MTNQCYAITYQPATTGGDGASTTRILLSGEFDIAAGGYLRAAVLGAVYAGAGDRVVVDLADVTFIDSSTIRVLLDGFSAAKDEGVGYQVINPVGVVRRVLDVMGLTDLLQLNGTVT